MLIATRSWFALFALIFTGFPATAQTQPAPAVPGDWHPPADTTTLELWPGGAPGPQTATGPEHDTTTSADRDVAGRRVMRIGDVSDPTITLYRAPADRNSGAAVVVFPGGAYRILAIDLEGTEVCNWLNSIRVNCVLLKYRVPNSGPYQHEPNPVLVDPKLQHVDKSSYYRHVEALQDAQRALGIVRQHAAEWGIDPHRVGVLGFSAGGHLAAAISTHYEKRLYNPVDGADHLSCRPDFALVIYPGYLVLDEEDDLVLNPDIPVTSKVPPTFLVQAEDDPVHVENALLYFLFLKRAGVPAELHVYAKGGHGYGLRRTALPITAWPEAAEKWLHTIGVLTEPGQ